MSTTYDVIVLGAGAVGSAAAYHAAKAGAKVLLIEQFALNHKNGSSYGYSRIIRYSYDHPAYVALAKTVYPMWAALEAEAGEQFYLKTGGLDFGPANDDILNNTFASVAQMGIAHEELSPQEAMQRYPQFKLNEDWRVLYQPDSGMLRASRCVLAHIRLAQQHGAVVRSETPVTGIFLKDSDVEVQTQAERFSAAKLIVTAGSWAAELLATYTNLQLPLQPLRCQVMFFDADHLADYGPDRFPTFIAHLSATYGTATYGMAAVDGSGVKIAFHGGDPASHPRDINYTPDADTEARIRVFSGRHLPRATGAMVEARICLYTMTPDEHFILDVHPQYPQIVIGSACSGHGFKFSTLSGKILADLALEGHTQHDISLFNIGRFV